MPDIVKSGGKKSAPFSFQISFFFSCMVTYMRILEEMVCEKSDEVCWNILRVSIKGGKWNSWWIIVYQDIHGNIIC